MVDLDFAEAAALMERVAGARMTLPRADYLAALETGEITDEDLRAALSASTADDLPPEVSSLRETPRAGLPIATAVLLPTVADLAGRVTGFDWAGFVTDRISAWAAARFDPASSAAWRRRLAGARHPTPRGAREAMVDRQAEIAGLRGARARAAALPESAVEVIDEAAAKLGMSGERLELYLHRILMSIGGWAAFARRLEREGRAGVLRELLAIRLAWELLLLENLPEAKLGDQWRMARREYCRGASRESRRALAIDLLLHDALERARRRDRLRRLAAAVPARPGPRASVQAVFCIDVRSEVLRRAMESLDDGAETLGFAGFFGLPIDYRGPDADRGEARCPVLLEPSLAVREIPAASGSKTRRRPASDGVPGRGPPAPGGASRAPR